MVGFNSVQNSGKLLDHFSRSFSELNESITQITSLSEGIDSVVYSLLKIYKVSKTFFSATRGFPILFLDKKV